MKKVYYIKRYDSIKKIERNKKIYFSGLFIIAILALITFQVRSIKADSLPDTSAVTSPVNSPSGSNSTPGSCSATAPSSSPHLFQIKSSKTSATVYFSPSNGPVSYYAVMYGYAIDKIYRFSASFGQGPTNGVLSYKIDDLSPTTTYVFKVMSGNGCSAGVWSNELTAKTQISPNRSAIFTAWEQIQKEVASWSR